MNMFTTSRIAKFFALALFLLSATCYAQHPRGKWYPAFTLPGLGSSLVPPQLLFVDSLLGYYIGQDSGFVTKDGGQSWKMMSFGPDAHPSPSFLFAPEHNTVIAFQKYGQDTDGTNFPGIIKSTDMGSSWEVVSASNWLPQKVKAFTMWTVTDGYRLWVDDATQKIVTSAVTHDGGVTWTDVRSDATLTKYDTLLLGKSTLSVNSAWSDSLHGALSFSASSGSSTAEPVLTTTNGGRTWTETYPNFNGNTAISHSYVYLYPGSQTIWAIPSVPNTAEYMFYSTDFGTTWVNTPQFARGALGVGGNTKPGFIQLAPISSTETWALLASDTDHPDKSRFIAYNNFSTGWERDTNAVFSLKGAGPFGFQFNGIQFADRNHGWAMLTQTYFDVPTNSQITKDSLFIYSFRSSTPVQDVKPISVIPALRCIPNPASSLIKIEGFVSSEEVRGINIVNTLGKESSTTIKNSGSEIELDLSSFPSGCYYINLNTSLRKESIPVMVVR